eukprot:m.82268 g.82268  ORF g.82268 m.82268 type:complete len:230 (-) comp14723_c0_seq3:14-703(-)
MAQRLLRGLMAVGRGEAGRAVLIAQEAQQGILRSNAGRACGPLVRHIAAFHASPASLHFCSHAEERAKRSLQARGNTAVEDLPESQTVYGCRRRIPVSPQKLNVLAKQIRNLPIDDAIKQMEFSPKKAASQIHQVLRITKRNAEYHHGIEDSSNMHVRESYVGKGRYTHGIRRANRGRGFRSDKPQAHYFLKLQVGPPAEKEFEAPSLYTRRLLQRLDRRPRRILNSLE